MASDSSQLMGNRQEIPGKPNNSVQNAKIHDHRGPFKIG
jgi:hypothetical protein